MAKWLISWQQHKPKGLKEPLSEALKDLDKAQAVMEKAADVDDKMLGAMSEALKNAKSAMKETMALCKDDAETSKFLKGLAKNLENEEKIFNKFEIMCAEFIDEFSNGRKKMELLAKEFLKDPGEETAKTLMSTGDNIIGRLDRKDIPIHTTAVVESMQIITRMMICMEDYLKYSKTNRPGDLEKSLKKIIEIIKEYKKCAKFA